MASQNDGGEVEGTGCEQDAVEVALAQGKAEKTTTTAAAVAARDGGDCIASLGTTA